MKKTGRTAHPKGIFLTPCLAHSVTPPATAGAEGEGFASLRGIAGIDEAGRGCLAGPVVAAAVVLPQQYNLPGLTDSKALRPEQREALAQGIRAQAVAWGLGVVWQKDIDRVNILQATFAAMGQAVRSLRRRRDNTGNPLTPSLPYVPAHLRIDGNKTLPDHIVARYLPAPIPQSALVDGDALEPCISAASILAKTFRDTLMTHLHRRWPVYDFARHKGYGTREHREALAAHGACPLHRLTFGGVRPASMSVEQVRHSLGYPAFDAQPSTRKGKNPRKTASSGTGRQGQLLLPTERA